MTLFSRMTSAEGVYLNSIPIYDTHEHLAPCEAAREKETDILREYLRHYMASSVISAGLSQKDFLYVRDASKPLMERWNMVEPYWEYNRHTGYGQAVDISVKKLYGYSILPVRVIRLLLSMEMYKTTFHSCGIFPSPKIADAPLGPAVVRERLSKILELAVSEHVCFHNLRHPYVKHTTKIFSLRLMNFQAQAYPDARRKTRGACQLHRGGQSQSPVRPLCNRKRLS